MMAKQVLKNNSGVRDGRAVGKGCRSWRRPQTGVRNANETCSARQYRKMAQRLEKYRSLNGELTQEIAALRVSEQTNREYHIMFDRFTLKFAQSVPRVQLLKKRLEESYDTLLELEEMVNCFSNAERLRGFLLGEESFRFSAVPGVVDENEAAEPRVVIEPPPKQHRRFDEEGNIHTIVEEQEDSLNSKSSLIGRCSNMASNKTQSLTHSEQGSDVSDGSLQQTEEETLKRISVGSRRSSIVPRGRRSSACLPLPPVGDRQKKISQQSSSEFPVQSISVIGKSDEEFSQCANSTTVMAEGPEEVVVPATETGPERSPTAINVAQIWAGARDAFPPANRSPTCTNIAAAWMDALQSNANSPVPPEPTSFLAPLATSVILPRRSLASSAGKKQTETEQSPVFLSPAIPKRVIYRATKAAEEAEGSPGDNCQLLCSSRLPIPTSTPAGDKTSQDFPKLSPLGLSIIEPQVPPNNSDDINRITSLLVEHVDRRPRKRKPDKRVDTPSKELVPASPWRSSLRATANGQENFANQMNVSKKNVRFSIAPQQNLTLLYKEEDQANDFSRTLVELRDLPSVNENRADSPSTVTNVIRGSRSIASRTKRGLTEQISHQTEELNENHFTNGNEQESEILPSRRRKKAINYSEVPPVPAPKRRRSPSIQSKKTRDSATFSQETSSEKVRNPRITYVVSRPEVSEQQTNLIVQRTQRQNQVPDHRSSSIKNRPHRLLHKMMPSEDANDVLITGDTTDTDASMDEKAGESFPVKRSGVRRQDKTKTVNEDVQRRSDASVTRTSSRASSRRTQDSCSSADATTSDHSGKESMELPRGRSSRRASASVSYVEPSLKAKCRRP